ncbi:MAG: hypothetical protein HGB10_07580 [Coriobacteriia bacterium]|nr:hypothetical protein [Coriobacteriia bacterium]
MVHVRPALPAGHGEILTRPEFSSWPVLLEANRAASANWSFEVAGVAVDDVRRVARAEALEAAAAFSGRLGVSVAAPGAPDGPIVATGHQPEFYHPGVWVKDFLLQRLADETGATALDVVVDTDGFDSVTVTSPCVSPGMSRCVQYLAVGTEDGCYAGAAVPSEHDLDDFCRSAQDMLDTLSAPAIGTHFRAFCANLKSAAGDAANLAELVTIARRRFEASAGTGYLELPITELVKSKGWSHYVVDLALSAHRFAEAYNAELAEYRLVNKVRSAAQPFPDLKIADNVVELPLWRIVDGRRSGVRVRVSDDGVTILSSDGCVVVELPATGPDAVSALLASGEVLAPKALSLTLFLRMFVTDFMIHGVGGGRYDQVTDGVCRRYYGVEPPAFVVASATMYLPLGAHLVTDEEVALAKDRLNRLEHNPDALLGEVEFDSPEEHDRAVALAAEKASLVRAIASPDADKKALGMRIRDVNTELAALLAALKVELTAELDSLLEQQRASEVLTDRTYPFCFWSPQEVADKVR